MDKSQGIYEMGNLLWTVENQQHLETVPNQNLTLFINLRRKSSGIAIEHYSKHHQITADTENRRFALDCASSI